ncbi:MAG TPA: GIY-YIG nuclease family protein [Aliidongia sp.]|nr:GIY-YIG nuclease family protein [Aliidongia sp.]
MDKLDRKAAIAAYKERKSVAGIYAVRCTATGQVWVGQAPNLDTIKSRLWFGLRHGGCTNPALQRAWTVCGADSFTFEPLERLAEETFAYVRNALLRERSIHWRAQLGAQEI